MPQLSIWAPRTGRRHTSPRRPARPTLESLENRVALSWFGAPPSAINPPTNASGLTLNTQGDAQGTAAITANEVDYYTFTAPTTGTYRFYAVTPSSNLDTVLGVFSSGGTRLASNDDISFSNRDSQLAVNLTAGSRYYFGITNYSGSAGGSYTWAVDGPASTTTTPTTDDSFEQNDALTQASSLGTLTAARTVSNLVMADSADWFSFTTTAAGTSTSSVSISFQNAQGNLDLELYNASGQRVGVSSSTSNVETISLNGLGAGTYYVRAFGAAGATNPNYTLTVTPPAASTPSTGSFDIVIRDTGLTASQELIFERAAARWEQIIVGDIPNATYQGIAVDDILIDARSTSIDGRGGILGQAGPEFRCAGSRLPIHGVMQFDAADLASMEANGTLYDVILHEMGHVLGVGTIWQSLGLLTGAGTTNPRFTGARATAEYNALFGTNETSVPVEGLPSPAGSRDGHWRESVFRNELMSPYISGSPNPISRVTVASLADIGYTVNMNAADSFTLSSVRSVASTTTTSSRTSIVSVTPPASTSNLARKLSLSRSVASWLRT